VITTVVLTAQARKDLRNLPAQIVRKFAVWTRFVEEEGLEEARKIPGFHDEPLKGEVHFAEVQEVNKHKY
jgi:toxin HigB-1